MANIPPKPPHPPQTLALLDTWKLMEYLSIFSELKLEKSVELPISPADGAEDLLDVFRPFDDVEVQKLVGFGKQLKRKHDQRKKSAKKKFKKPDEEKHFDVKIVLLPFNSRDVYTELASHFKDHSFADNQSNQLSYLAEFSFHCDTMELNPNMLGVSGIPSALEAILANHFKFDYNAVQREIVEVLDAIWSREGSAVSKTTEFIQFLLDKWKWKYGLQPQAYCMLIDPDRPPPGIIQSFYTSDLERLKKVEHGLALHRFLNKTTDEEKVDLTVQTDFVKQLLSAKNIPEGTWPTTFSLALMQQFAVNKMGAMAEEHSGLFSVNGPPGTGKTSMLKDAFAAIIVRRAKAMMEFADPNDAFKKANNRIFYSDEFQGDWYLIDPKITGHEIVVGSTNNAAVENISNELPKIDPDFINDYGDYPENVHFKDLGNFILNYERKEEVQPLQAWNFTSVPLGNRKNCWKFATVFRSTERDKLGIRNTLKAGKETVLPWADVVKNFKEKLSDFDTLKQALIQLESELEKGEVNLEELKEEYGRHLPDEAFWKAAFAKGEAANQLHAPWMTAALNKASFELFFEALALHKAFVIYAEKPMTSNLNAIQSQMLGSTNFQPKVIEHCWRTLFLLTPVISTTFASVARLFDKLGKEFFGWLFIDEAGQAVPQAAVGAIYRSKRVVVVGDPLQIEPIVPIPTKALEWFEKGLPEHAKKEFLKMGTSVQVFADEANNIGVTMEKKHWVGSPLRVHRRCQSPMFEISNQIAYQGLMQQGNGAEEEHPLGPSRFIQIAGDASNLQWVKPQTDRVIFLLNEYLPTLRSNTEVDIFVISPFVSVVEGLRRDLRKQFPFMAEQMKNNIGTVHKFQGKETNVVILVLGCDNSRKGAVKWACSSPNILNVAVTRAKQVLIVIGDKNVWRGEGYFASMLGLLEG